MVGHQKCPFRTWPQMVLHHGRYCDNSIRKMVYLIATLETCQNDQFFKLHHHHHLWFILIWDVFSIFSVIAQEMLFVNKPKLMLDHAKIKSYMQLHQILWLVAQQPSGSVQPILNVPLPWNTITEIAKQCFVENGVRIDAWTASISWKGNPRLTNWRLAFAMEQKIMIVWISKPTWKPCALIKAMKLRIESNLVPIP